MKFVKILLILALLFSAACQSAKKDKEITTNTENVSEKSLQKPENFKEIPESSSKFPKGSFAYPVGEKDFVTEKNDLRDNWYNAQDFGENRHLGEDWNKNSGGNTDCGEPVFSAADGKITFAKDVGAGWGNVVIIEHTAPNGTTLQTLYGHLERIEKSEGEVKRREKIGTIGSANGRYPCHLHFELRRQDCPFWNQTGAGYSDERKGWIDPSEFIEKTR